MVRRAGRIRFRPVGARQNEAAAPVYGPTTTGCPVVEQAVERLYAAGPEESMERFWSLMSALNYALQIETDVLIPLELAPGVHDSAAPWGEHPIPAQRAGTLRHWVLRTEKGKNFLPLFTYSGALTESQSTAGRPVIQRRMLDAMEMVLGSDRLDGVVINPWGRSATLDKALLRGLLRAEPTEPEPGEAEAQKGLEAAQKGDWAAAAACYQASSELGCPAGTRLLAECIYNGQGVKKSLPEAMRLWQKAADAGDILAVVALGDRSAESCPGDPGRALLYYRRAQELAADQPDIDYQPLLCLRLAQYETRYTSAREALLLAAEAKRGFGVRQRNGDPAAGPLLVQADALAAELLARPQPKAAYNTEPSQMG